MYNYKYISLTYLWQTVIERKQFSCNLGHHHKLQQFREPFSCFFLFALDHYGHVHTDKPSNVRIRMVDSCISNSQRPSKALIGNYLKFITLPFGYYGQQFGPVDLIERALVLH